MQSRLKVRAAGPTRASALINYYIFSYPSTFPAVKPMPLLTGDLNNTQSMLCKLPNSKLLCVFLPCQRIATDNLTLRVGRKGMPVAGRWPQSPPCLQNSEEPHFDDRGFFFVCFSASWQGLFLCLEFPSPKRKLPTRYSFSQVLICLLSVYHVPSFMLSMVNTGHIRLINKVPALGN